MCNREDAVPIRYKKGDRVNASTLPPFSKQIAQNVKTVR